MTNEELDKLWKDRNLKDNPVRKSIEGKGKDSDFMTIQFENGHHEVYERKANTSLWERVQ